MLSNPTFGMNPIGGNVYSQAGQGLTGAMQATAQHAFAPMQTGPMTVGATDLNQYMNPFQSQVIGNLAADTGRMMQMGSNQLGAAATAADAGERWRAISWTTAASVCAVVEMVANKTLPTSGFLKQEEIPFDAFMETQNGSLYARGAR